MPRPVPGAIFWRYKYISKIWSQQQLQRKTSCEKWGKMWKLEVDDHKEI
jgi:hypothetical protein